MTTVLPECFSSPPLGVACRIRMGDHLDRPSSPPLAVGPNRLEQALARERATFPALVLYNDPWMPILRQGLRGGWARVAGAGSGADYRRRWMEESVPLPRELI